MAMAPAAVAVNWNDVVEPIDLAHLLFPFVSLVWTPLEALANIFYEERIVEGPTRRISATANALMQKNRTRKYEYLSLFKRHIFFLIRCVCYCDGATHSSGSIACALYFHLLHSPPPSSRFLIFTCLSAECIFIFFHRLFLFYISPLRLPLFRLQLQHILYVYMRVTRGNLILDQIACWFCSGRLSAAFYSKSGALYIFSRYSERQPSLFFYLLTSCRCNCFTKNHATFVFSLFFFLHPCCRSFIPSGRTSLAI